MNKASRKTVGLITFASGGPFVWAKQMARELREHGYIVSLVTDKKGYIVSQLRFFDIVHTCVPIPNILSTKYILTIHGNYREEKHLSRYLFPLAIERADSVTTPSSFLKNTLELENSVVIPNGIPVPKQHKTNYSLLNTIPAVGILSNFHFKEKARGILQLAKLLNGINSASKLFVGGDGAYFAEYVPQIRDAHPNTEFLGYCQKESLFEKIDIFAYYSFLDNQPLAVLEAMAYGLPVISKDVGGIREIFSPTTDQYCLNTDTAYIHTLSTLLKSKNDREWCGKYGRQNAEKFTVHEMAKNYIRLYS